MSSTMACIAQPCGVSPIFSCSAHSSGTEFASATIFFSTAILCSIALARRPDEPRRLRRRALDEFMALLGEQLDAVGGQQLVVADRGRDRALAAMRKARLHVMIAVAAGLERIDPHRLLARQPGSRAHSAHRRA